MVIDQNIDSEKPLGHRFKEQMIESVSTFALKCDISEWPGEGDELFKCIRKFYMLLPRVGLGNQWSDINKSTRRSLIVEHVKNVCEESSTISSNIEIIDNWLVNINLPKIQLGLYARQVEEAYGLICFICGRKIIDGKSIDHVLPLSRGGENIIENYRMAHKGCNSSKNNMMVGDQVVWTPQLLSAELDAIPLRLRYMVFLRDNFKCTDLDCCHGIHTKQEVYLALRNETGICCYDNLRTQCGKCFKNY